NAEAHPRTAGGVDRQDGAGRGRRHPQYLRHVVPARAARHAYRHRRHGHRRPGAPGGGTAGRRGADGHHDAHDGRLRHDPRHSRVGAVRRSAHHRADGEGHERRSRKMPASGRLRLHRQTRRHRLFVGDAASLAASLKVSMTNRDNDLSILIVDDRPDKLLALSAVLADLCPSIVTADSGRQALKYLLERDFAVILLDVNMPGMDVFETAALIRQRKSLESTPIIFVTSYGDDMHVAQGYSLGAVDYILSPIVPAVLRTKVAVFLELCRKTREVEQQALRLRQRAEQLHKLTQVSLEIHSAHSMEKILRLIADTARDVVGAH